MENEDLFVYVDSNDGEGLILQTEFSEYVIENLTDRGGDIVFQPNFIPIGLARVLIKRQTTISQQVDYLEFEAFQAETHEFNLDKITYILQELLGSALGDGNLTFDLAAVPTEFEIEITNTGGTNALIPSWESGLFAGAFIGEVTDSAPADESASTKPDGYVYYETT